jgi:hypothetical protein
VLAVCLFHQCRDASRSAWASGRTKRIKARGIQRTSRPRPLQNTLMASYITRSTTGKRKSEIQGIIQAAEVSKPKPLEQLSAPLAFQDRMRFGKAAKLARKVRGVARVSAVVPKATKSALDTLATVEAQPSAYKDQLVADALHELEAKRRPVYQARVVLRDSLRAETAEPEGEAPGPFGTLRIDSSERQSDFYLQTMEQMLVAAGAGRTISLSKPVDSLLSKRRFACVQLHDSAGEWQGSDERSKVWIEYLSTADLDQGVVESTPRRAGAVSRRSSTLGGPWFGEALAMGYNELRHLAKSFHTRGKRVAEETHDKFHKDAVSIEFGYSTYVGGSKLQMQAWKNGEAYERIATAIARDKPLGKLVERAADLAWDFVVRRYPSISKKMLDAVGIYGIYGTGFSKVTIAYDNPTCAHYDSNYGADVILAFRLKGLQGGDHVMWSVDGRDAIAVETSDLGVLIGGCHEHLLHGNLATTDGGRVVLAWYLPQALLDRIGTGTRTGGD